MNPEKKIVSKIEDKSIDLIIKASSNKNAVSVLDEYIINDSFFALISKIKNTIDEDGFFEWLPVFIAMTRYAGEKALNVFMFDVQILGGLVIFSGNIAEMLTGEGKTFTAVLPVFLNYICGRKVHIVTVNDYLAKRDCEWMKPVYDILGIQAGYIQYDMSPEEKRKAYCNDVVYGSNNEFGFDYLRDNMVNEASEVVQGKLDCVIIDEIDSVLIDEARVPLVISGMSYQTPVIFKLMNNNVKQFLNLKDSKHYCTIDYDKKKVDINSHGWTLMQHLCSNLKLEEHDLRQMANTFLKAYLLFKRDKEYIVQDGRVIIVDEFTGRQMLGRRYKAGLHQALEAKEGLTVEGESQILATVTFQKYFKQYNKMSGMTGTAKTEEKELNDLYGLKVFQIPTNKPCIRSDEEDIIYVDEKSKYKAVVDYIKECNNNGNPVLVGTKSVEKSELISVMLNFDNIKHNVLNAKNHELEADIVKQAGCFKNVTVATNMAGRGTDIILDEESKQAGGLVVIGTEKHDAQRIDNQLRGRAARQGDPGRTLFFISFDDEMFYDYNMNDFKDLVDGNKKIEDNIVRGFMNGVQDEIEYKNSVMRKTIYEFDNVFSKYRDFAYNKRKIIFDVNNVGKLIFDVINDIVEIHHNDPEIFPFVNINTKDKEEIKDIISCFIDEKIKRMKSKNFYGMAKTLYLTMFDKYWNRFLNFIDNFMSEIKTETDALDILEKESESAFINTWYLIEKNFLILLLFNDKIGELVLDETKINY